PLLLYYASTPQNSYLLLFFFFFFNHTAPTQIYTLSLHDALPISRRTLVSSSTASGRARSANTLPELTSIASPLLLRLRISHLIIDRKSTRLNSSHVAISYAVFCLKKKKKIKKICSI